MEANMSTRIRFKRGETDAIKSYLDAYVGEPLLNRMRVDIFASIL